MIYASNSGTNGRLYNRFRYLRQKSKNIGNENTVPTQTQEDRAVEYAMNDLLWLKTVVISSTNIAEIRRKLDMTRQLRDEIVQKDTVELMQEFPFFFTHPHLVSIIINFFICISFEHSIFKYNSPFFLLFEPNIIVCMLHVVHIVYHLIFHRS